MAEDSRIQRESLIELVKHKFPDFEIDGVDDGLPLVEKVRLGRYDLIFTDNGMLSINGLEAIREIRKFDKDAPIYMLSGSDKEKEALKAGATGYIKKGVDTPKKVIEIMEKYLK